LFSVAFCHYSDGVQEATTPCFTAPGGHTASPELPLALTDRTPHRMDILGRAEADRTKQPTAPTDRVFGDQTGVRGEQANDAETTDRPDGPRFR
jgi:hypothetical protein